MATSAGARSPEVASLSRAGSGPGGPRVGPWRELVSMSRLDLLVCCFHCQLLSIWPVHAAHLDAVGQSAASPCRWPFTVMSYRSERAIFVARPHRRRPTKDEVMDSRQSFPLFGFKINQTEAPVVVVLLLLVVVVVVDCTKALRQQSVPSSIIMINERNETSG